MNNYSDMKVKVKRHSDYPNAVLPVKAHPTDAGADLTVVKVEVDFAHKVNVYHSGLCFEIPEGYVGLLFPRSSVYRTGMTFANCVGVIDSHYRGEVTAKMCVTAFLPSEPKPYDVGDRFAQMVIVPIPDVEYELSDELSETDRGEGGYGSTGR